MVLEGSIILPFRRTVINEIFLIERKKRVHPVKPPYKVNY